MLKKNSVTLSDTVPPFSSPRRATEEDKFFVFSSLFLPASLSPRVLCQNLKPDATHAPS